MRFDFRPFENDGNTTGADAGECLFDQGGDLLLVLRQH
jgi:hypothetical protein